MIKDLFKTSATIHKGGSLRANKQRIKFLLSAAVHHREVRSYYDRMEALQPYKSMALSPELLGRIQWPYLHNEWAVEDKLNVTASHYELLNQTPCPLGEVTPERPLLLLDLSFIAPGTKLVIDKPKWFIREGELVLNLFAEELRVYSLAFTFCQDSLGKKVFIGAMQGIHSGVSSEESLEIIKKISKQFQGLRPVSLLMETLRIICACMDIQAIYAIADEHRHHRHPYFGVAPKNKFNANYNSIWVEHGGQLLPDIGFYQLPLEATHKPLEDVLAKKRAMYRRRYAFLTELRGKVETLFSNEPDAPLTHLTTPGTAT